MLAWPAQLPAQDRLRIQATGMSSYRPADAARSRQEALKATLQDAVERVSGLLITTESETRNFSLVRDEVLSRSQGFVREYTIVEEGREADFYRVRVEAQVVKAAFLTAFNDSLEALYRRMGMPRILVLAQERGSGQGENPGRVAAKLRARLIEEGFTVVSGKDTDQAASAEAVLEGKAQATGSLLEMAGAGKAELMLASLADLSYQGLLDSHHALDATVRLQMLRAGSGQVMAAGSGQGRGLHPNRSTAESTALDKALERALPPLLEQVSFQWIREQSEGATVLLVVKEASFGDVQTLVKWLGNAVGGVAAVRQRSYAAREANLELKTRKAPHRLAEALLETDFGGIRLEIEGVTDSSVTVRLIKN